jgi:colanic acid biosynthesis glycosyl transferase WcaI
MRRKFLLISGVFYPDEVSTSALFTGLCAELVKKGYDAEVWCGQPSYTVRRRQPKTLKYNGITIRYLLSTNFPKGSLPGRIFNILTFIASAVFKVAFSPEKIPIYTVTNPPFLGIALSLICRIRRRKLIYIILDVYPEGLIRVGKVSAGNILIRLWHRLFIASLKRCYKIIVIGRDMKRWLEEVCPECVSRTEYIPHWQDDGKISPVDFEDNPLVRELNLSGRFVVQYSGNMGLWNEMEVIGKTVNKNIENVFFLFIGGGIRKDELTRMISDTAVKNTVFLPFQPDDRLRFSLTACHAALITLKEGLEGMAVPCKIYGILAAGIPVIALVPENSEIAMVVREEECGYVLNPGDAEGLERAIIDLRENVSRRTNMGINSRNAFENKYKTEIIAGRYAEMLDTIEI